MDRNGAADINDRCIPQVALRKESVDRNIKILRPSPVSIRSLSARRAWIEMVLARNWFTVFLSLSARRAWIEITSGSIQTDGEKMSLSARRAWIEIGNS